MRMPVTIALFDQIEEQRVRGGEDRGIFHPQPDEIVDVEESPVVDLVERGAPVRQAIRLRVEQRVQAIEAGRVAAPRR